MFTRVGQPMLLHGDAVYGGGIQKGTLPLAQLLAGFQSFPLLPTSKFGPSGADSRLSEFVYVLGPCGPLQGTLL